ncbi:MAG TPA: GTPase Era [bacterium]|jgi:GTP-binding protein Era|nr:GTPase Era [bacterium]
MGDQDLICGAVAVLGRPNVGKSTFLNSVLQTKIAIVSPRPQTTRGSMAGIFQDDEAQIVFYDTPGIHQPKNKLSQFMLRQVEEVLAGSEAALFLVDVREGLTEEDYLVAEWLQKFKSPVFVVLNKIDGVLDDKLAPLEEKIKTEWPQWSILRTAAISGRGVPEVATALKKILPRQPLLFPADELTDKTMRDIAGEMVREQCFLQLKEEIPYGVAVLIDSFEEKELPAPVVIKATIFVEKDSQKGIIIGAGGNQLKLIGSASRVEIEKLLDRKVFLELWVKVLKNWRKDEDVLKRLGYSVPRK